jgi:Prokaryotic E2 family E
MDLPKDDEEFLSRKGYSYELVPVREGACLIVAAYPVNANVYDRSQVDLMVRIPAQYNIAALDMYYVEPVLRLKGGEYPQAASQFESHAGRQWQRFSRHLASPWRAGVDGLQMFFALISKELQAKG